MKKQGSTSDFISQRDQELYRHYVALIRNASGEINLREIYREISEKPASRFWVSEERASAIIGHMEAVNRKRVKAGLPPFDLSNPKTRAMVESIAFGSKILPKRAEMYREIYARYLKSRALHPESPISHIVAEIIEQDAPSFYLTPSAAKRIITSLRRARFRPATPPQTPLLSR